MWDDFHEAFAHREHRVLGRKLKPYCSYHLLWLKIVKSKLITGGTITLPDLDIAARICSANYGQAQAAIAPHRLDKLAYMWKALRYRLNDEIAKFQDYTDDFNSPPTPETRGGESTFRGEHLPHEIWTVSGLMSILHMTREEAWMCPLGEAEWLLSTSNLHRDKPSNILNGQDREYVAWKKKKQEVNHGEKQ